MIEHSKLKVLFVFFLTGLLLLLALQGPARSEEAGPRSGEGNGKEDLVFTYTRSEAPKENVAANISVVTRKDIEKMPASTVAEVLQNVPGVVMDSSGGLGSPATPIIQGSTDRKFGGAGEVAVYVDGVRVNMLANPGFADLSYIPLSSVERIEVYKGAASSSWGSSLGGVINIITREPSLGKPVNGYIESSYGDFNTYKEHAALDGGIGRFGYLLSLVHDASDGYTPRWLKGLSFPVPEVMPTKTGYRQDAAYTKLNYYIGAASRLSFVYSYDEGRYLDPNNLGLSDPDKRDLPQPGKDFLWSDIFQKRAYERLLFDTSLTDQLSMTLEARHQLYNQSRIDTYPDDPDQNGGYSYREDSKGASARFMLDNKQWNRFTFGFDGDWADYDYTGYTVKYFSRAWALYANDSFDWKKFTFTGGIRYDNNYDFGSEVSPSGGVVYHIPWREALIRFQVAKGFTAPPGPWVQDPYFGNKSLKPEVGINYQLGGEIKPFRYTTLGLNLFRADVDQLIKFDPTAGKDGEYINIAKATRQGVEGSIQTLFPFGLGESFAVSFIDAVNADTGEVIYDIPRFIINSTTSYTYKWMSHSLIARFIDNNSSYPETNDGVVVFDYQLKIRLPVLEPGLKPGLTFAVHDLTDSGYLYRYRLAPPGRWFEGGLRLEF